MRRMSFPEEPFALRQMAPRTRRKGLIAGLVVGAVMVLAGGGVAAFAATRPTSSSAPGRASIPAPTSASPATDTQPSSSAASASPTAAASAAADDPAGRAACEQIIKANGTDDLYAPAKMKPIGTQAAKSTNGALRMDGNLLVDHADLAKAAKGGENEFSTSLGLGTAAMNLIADCYKAGYGKN